MFCVGQKVECVDAQSLTVGKIYTVSRSFRHADTSRIDLKGEESVSEPSVGFYQWRFKAMPAATDPRWRTSTVLDLIQTIKSNPRKNNVLFPVLADALVDAGCDESEIINHLHLDHSWWYTAYQTYQTCWAIEQVLGNNQAGDNSGKQGTD